MIIYQIKTVALIYLEVKKVSYLEVKNVSYLEVKKFHIHVNS